PGNSRTVPSGRRWPTAPVPLSVTHTEPSWVAAKAPGFVPAGRANSATVGAGQGSPAAGAVVVAGVGPPGPDDIGGGPVVAVVKGAAGPRADAAVGAGGLRGGGPRRRP